MFLTSGTAADPADRDAETHTTTRDAGVLAMCTAVSRVTGIARVVAVGAVLGPTFLGNAFQVTNSLPNLIYYGFLAGSLTSSIVVPALVRHIHARHHERVAALSGGVLALSMTACLFLLPVAVIGVPILLRLASSGNGTAGVHTQTALATFLVMLTVPQVFLYAVAGTATAVMYAHRRFALAAAAPALENLGVITVLGIVAARYGGASGTVTPVPGDELLILGVGATASVGVHAAVQWWGAWRCGVVLRPRAWWREPEVMQLVRRAVHAIAQAGLLATSMLTMLLIATRLPGGAVALQIALNFYFLPIALIVTPIGLAALPRMAALHQGMQSERFLEVLSEACRLAVFLVVPASVGCALVAHQVVRAVNAGAMGAGAGYAMTSGALMALAAGLVGQAVFFVSAQASYARGDTVTPLRSMAWQTLVCLTLCLVAVSVADGPRLVVMVGGAYAVASLVGGLTQLTRVLRGRPSVTRALAGSSARALVGSLVLALPVWLSMAGVAELAPGRVGSVLQVLTALLVGVGCYVAVHGVMRSPELGLVRAWRSTPALEVLASEST